MKFNITKKYFTVGTFQLLLMSLLTSIISAAIVSINIALIDYLHLPVVTFESGKCVNVSNFKNGDSYTCDNVDVILRKYREK